MLLDQDLRSDFIIDQYGEQFSVECIYVPIYPVYFLLLLCVCR